MPHKSGVHQTILIKKRQNQQPWICHHQGYCRWYVYAFARAQWLWIQLADTRSKTTDQSLSCSQKTMSWSCTSI